MPGLKDNQKIELRVNKYGSIQQKKSRNGDGYFFMIECEVGEKKEKVWGEMEFLEALVSEWPGAEGLCTIERLNAKRYEVTITEPGDMELGPELKTWDDDEGGFVQLEMPDFDGPAPKQPKSAQKAEPTGRIADPPSITFNDGPAPAKQAPTNGKTTEDITRRYTWALGLSQSIWNETFTNSLGSNWEPDNAYWENVRASANSLFIESAKLPKDAFTAAVSTAVEALDGEVVKDTAKEGEDDLPF
jgi:hypothetical protein